LTREPHSPLEYTKTLHANEQWRMRETEGTRYKKHKCWEGESKESRKILDDLNESTYKPKLIDNVYNQKVRQKQEDGKDGTIYHRLYEDANNRKLKIEILRAMFAKECRQSAKPTINNLYFF
jgi:hypothetical protein